jgi:hypothetical protein
MISSTKRKAVLYRPFTVSASALSNENVHADLTNRRARFNTSHVEGNSIHCIIA